MPGKEIAMSSAATISVENASGTREINPWLIGVVVSFIEVLDTSIVVTLFVVSVVVRLCKRFLLSIRWNRIMRRLNTRWCIRSVPCSLLGELPILILATLRDALDERL